MKRSFITPAPRSPSEAAAVVFAVVTNLDTANAAVLCDVKASTICACVSSTPAAACCALGPRSRAPELQQRSWHRFRGW
ncbi:unnamed protein product [Pleuronectes platessa]|uniref:Uncharacterized protein n=1 Tax=Pleuronectes platessa TaxID=8262 RepID=A0A9N7UY05_PLEPL|nr:unnamed protein product [Pleuronectes platessa]